MISSNAQHTINKMVERAIQASPMVAGDGTRTVEVGTALERVTSDQVVVLTVLSYAFRLTFLVHFSDDEATRAHFATPNRVADGTWDEQAFVDAIRECGNISCGNLNRDLVRFFPHVGMSTPNIISRRCAEHLDKLEPDYTQHFGLLDSAGPAFAVTVCVKAFTELDFSGDFEEAEATGELEMF